MAGRAIVINSDEDEENHRSVSLRSAAARHEGGASGSARPQSGAVGGGFGSAVLAPHHKRMETQKKEKEGRKAAVEIERKCVEQEKIDAHLAAQRQKAERNVAVDKAAASANADAGGRGEDHCPQQESIDHKRIKLAAPLASEGKMHINLLSSDDEDNNPRPSSSTSSWQCSACTVINANPNAKVCVCCAVTRESSFFLNVTLSYFSFNYN